ncbi:hypothetical protein M2146_000351 [Lachnospiraceae bacterium PF1-22]|uniref:plasmid mobilization protein n=1 Tax=Ohessyouella blattaphilus TaxID=2949333 RepID=UPI003E19895C
MKENLRRTKKLEVRVTEDELDIIKLKANGRGLKTADYCRLMLSIDDGNQAQINCFIMANLCAKVNQLAEINEETIKGVIEETWQEI